VWDHREGHVLFTKRTQHVLPPIPGNRLCGEMVSLTITVVDDRVHDGHVAAAVCVPSIGIFSRILTDARTSNVDVVKYHVGGIRDKVIVLWAIPQLQVGKNAVPQSVDANQHRPQSVDVSAVLIIPYLAVTVERTTCLASAIKYNAYSGVSDHPPVTASSVSQQTSWAKLGPKVGLWARGDGYLLAPGGLFRPHNSRRTMPQP